MRECLRLSATNKSDILGFQPCLGKNESTVHENSQRSENGIKYFLSILTESPISP